MILVVTDRELADLARGIGSPFFSESNTHLWDIALSNHVTGLVLLRGLVNPGAYERMAAETFHRDLLRAKTLSLMSDMWDIPLFAVLFGGPQIMPTTESGVYWAMLGEAIRARMARIVRVNGLFGMGVPNNVLAAMSAEKPTFDSTFKISPIHQDQLIGEIRDWCDRSHEYREMPWRETFMGNKVVTTWYEVASALMVEARPWDRQIDKYRRKPSVARYSTRGVHPYDVEVFDVSWESTRLEDIENPYYDGDWRKQFALMAKKHNQTLVNPAKDLFFA